MRTSVPPSWAVISIRTSLLGIRFHLLGRAALRAQQARIDLCACGERLSARRTKCVFPVAPAGTPTT